MGALYIDSVSGRWGSVSVSGSWKGSKPLQVVKCVGYSGQRLFYRPAWLELGHPDGWGLEGDVLDQRDHLLD